MNRFSNDTLTNFIQLKAIVISTKFLDMLTVKRHIRKHQHTYLHGLHPVHLIPLTRLGKDAQLIYRNYKTLGMADITLKIYDKRHALLFGKDRINVYTDILTWLKCNACDYI